MGLGADLGRRRRVRREDPVRPRGRVALAPVPSREGRELVHRVGPRAARARGRGAGGARRGGRHGRCVLPLPPGHRPPRHRDRGHDDPRGLDAAPRRRRPARRHATGVKAPAQPERILRWDGCVNVRDLGGLPLEGGGETAFGVVVRADSIRSLTDDGWQALVDYGVRMAVDLRSDFDAANDPPGDLPIEVVRIPVDGNERAGCRASGRRCRRRMRDSSTASSRSSPRAVTAIARGRRAGRRSLPRRPRPHRPGERAHAPAGRRRARRDRRRPRAQ